MPLTVAKLTLDVAGSPLIYGGRANFLFSPYCQAPAVFSGVVPKRLCQDHAREPGEQQHPTCAGNAPETTPPSTAPPVASRSLKPGRREKQRFFMRVKFEVTDEWELRTLGARTFHHLPVTPETRAE